MKLFNKIKTKYRKLRNYLFNCYILRKSLSEEFILSTDDMILSVNKEILDEAYKFWNDDSLEDYNRISNDALEDLYIARHMMNELISVRYDLNSTKDQISGMSKRTFEFIGKNMWRWWI